MYSEDKIWIALEEEKKLCILPRMANRHGLIAGATGTGKTVTLKVLAESFSQAGVPVVLADVKGDLSGICRQGGDSLGVDERVRKFDLLEKGFKYRGFPVQFWDTFAKKGLALRTTVTEFGPLLFSRLLGLNQTQSDILNIVFKIADDEGLLLIDLKDLKSMLHYVSENAGQYRNEYGNIAKQSVGAIMRALVSLEDRGGESFFGEPALDIHDWMKTDEENRGYINIIDSSSLIHDPLIYSTFMLWMLSELFETMPEVGDREKPRLVFFFDEAHLLFKEVPKALMQKIEQVMKLIRSKGIGVYFITQNPSDIPDEVLAQLGNKIQHALRAYTPAEQKAVRAAAQSYRSNPKFDTMQAMLELGIGEALISVIDEDGSPSVVSRAFILPPQSMMGILPEGDRNLVIMDSALRDKYSEAVDRDSAYEFFQRLYAEREEAYQTEMARIEAERTALEEERRREKEELARKKKTARNIASVGNTAVGTIGREIGNTLGQSVGGKFGKRLGGNVGASLGRGIFKTLFRI